jgi:DNA-binding MarR family transcriptional regulator
MTTARSVRRAYDKCLSAADVNPTEASIVSHLADGGPYTQVQLARLIATNRAQIGLNIDSLVDKGLVARHADPDDRRVWRIHLTPKGTRVSHQIEAIEHEVRRRLQVNTTVAQRRVLDQVLEQLHRNALALEEELLAPEPLSWPDLKGAAS